MTTESWNSTSNNATTVSPEFSDSVNTTWAPEDSNVTSTSYPNFTTTGLYQLRQCVYQNGGWKCPMVESGSMDPYLIVAIVCFSLGGVLLILGILRLIWFFYSPRKDHRKFKYILRLLEAKENGTHGYNDYVDNPALWY